MANTTKLNSSEHENEDVEQTLPEYINNLYAILGSIDFEMEMIQKRLQLLHNKRLDIIEELSNLTNNSDEFNKQI